MTATRDTRLFRYEISEDGTLMSANADWFAFAEENGAAGLTPDSVIGRPMWDFIAGSEVRHLYHVTLDRLKESGATIDLPYRCDSPDCRRLINMQLFHIPECKVFRFESRILSAEPRKPVDLLDPDLARGDELLLMCSWCKKILLDNSGWVEPEQAIESLKLFEHDTLPGISHGVCPDCEIQLHEELRSL